MHPNGHDGIRYRSTRQCVECKRASGRKGSKSRGSLSSAVRRQARWLNAFARNFAATARLGIDRVLSREYHGTPLQKWLYQMRARWEGHPKDRRTQLLSLGQEGWWLRTEPPRHQMGTGVLRGSSEYNQYKRAVNKQWRDKNAKRLRDEYRSRYALNPQYRVQAATRRQQRFDENPGLAAYLTSLRRRRERLPRCHCCSNSDLRKIYLEHGLLGLQTDHKVSLAIAIQTGLKGMHCVSNLQGLTAAQHRKKTSVDIGKLAEVRRATNTPCHTGASRAKSDAPHGSRGPGSLISSVAISAVSSGGEGR